MKKMLLITALMAAFSAQAVEVGVTGSRDYNGEDRNGYGITVGQKFKSYGVTAGFDRYATGSDLNKYSLVGSYDVAKVGPATIAVKAGAAYLDNKQGGNDGYAALVGVGVVMPINSQWASTIEYRYQAGQDRVKSFDGNTISAGIKYSF